MPVVYLLRRNTASVEKTRTTLEEDWQLGGCSESWQTRWPRSPCACPTSWPAICA